MEIQVKPGALFGMAEWVHARFVEAEISGIVSAGKRAQSISERLSACAASPAGRRI